MAGSERVRNIGSSGEKVGDGHVGPGYQRVLSSAMRLPHGISSFLSILSEIVENFGGNRRIYEMVHGRD